MTKQETEKYLQSKEKEKFASESGQDIRNFLVQNLPVHFQNWFEDIWVGGMVIQNNRMPTINRAEALLEAPDEVLDRLRNDGRVIAEINSKQLQARNVLNSAISSIERLRRELVKPPIEMSWLLNSAMLNDPIADAFNGVYQNLTLDDITRLMTILDLASPIKLCRYSPKSHEIFESVRAGYPNITEEEWRRQLYRGANARNALLGHPSIATYSRIESEELEEEINNYMVLCKEVAGSQRNAAYQELKRQISAKKSRLSFVLIPEEVILQKVNGLLTTPVTKEEITIIFERDIYNTTRTENGIWCESLNQAVMIVQREVETKGIDYLKRANEELERENITLHNDNERYKALTYNSNDKEQKAEVSLDEALDEALSCEAILQSLYDNNKKLNEWQISELLETHRIIVTESVIKSAEGRNYIQMFSDLSIRRGYTGKKARIFITANAYSNLFDERIKYKEADYHYRNSSDDEATYWIKEKKKLEKSKTGYYYLRDVLLPENTVKIICENNTGVNEGESIRKYVRKHFLERICILCQQDTSKINEMLMVTRGVPLCMVVKLTNPINLTEKTNKQPYLSVIGRCIQRANDASVMHAILSSYKEDEIISAIQETHIIGNNKRKIKHIASDGTRQTLYDIKRQDSINELSNVYINDNEKTKNRHSKESLITDETGAPVHITNILSKDGNIAEGGEGAIYETGVENIVAKIYHNGQNTEERHNKLMQMIKESPEPLENAGVMWPRHILYGNDGNFVGYIMKKVPINMESLGQSVMQINNPGSNVHAWTRTQLVEVAESIAKGIALLHRNHILMGDVNEQNILIDPNNASQVYFVDCDSYQYKLHPCPVGRREYTHPRVLAGYGTNEGIDFQHIIRTEEDEDYALAIMIFQILMCGQHPFATKNSTNAEQYAYNMQNKNFVYKKETAQQVPEGSWMIWKNLPNNTCEAFTDTFQEWKWIKASRWVTLLSQYKYSIKEWGLSDEITPVKYHEYDENNPVYIDAICPICKQEFNFSKDNRTDRELYDSGRLLCHNCLGTKLYLKNRIATGSVICEKCKKIYTPYMDEIFMHETLGDTYICPNCRKRKQTGPKISRVATRMTGRNRKG